MMNSNPKIPFLSIIIPVYNEQETIGLLLHQLNQTIIPVEYEIIIVDDGSNPPIKHYLKPFLKQFADLHLFRLQSNSGKGSAIRTGIKHAIGKYILIQDADLEYHPKDIPKLLDPIINDHKKVVYGSRYNHFKHHMTQFHFLGNILLTKMTNYLYNLKLSDMETGYKLFPRSYQRLLNLTTTDFDIEIELTAKLALHQIEIHEIPITYTYRQKGNAKISFFDGIEAVIAMIYYRCFEQNKYFHEFYSMYKRYCRPTLLKIVQFFKLR